MMARLEGDETSEEETRMWMFNRPGDREKAVPLASMRTLGSVEQVALEQHGSDLRRSPHGRFFSAGSVPRPPHCSGFECVYRRLDICIAFSFTLHRVSRVFFTKNTSESSIPVSEFFKWFSLSAGKAPTSNLKYLCLALQRLEVLFLAELL